MRISELSRTAGIPVATVKYYLREGLLHEGERTAATQAQYDHSHVARLRLIRALVGAGGLSLAGVRAVLEQLNHPSPSTHDLLGTAHQLIDTDDPNVGHGAEGATGADGASTSGTAGTAGTAEVEQLLDELGWHRPADPRPIRRLATALEALRAADFALPAGRLRDYAETMRALAEREVGDVPTQSEEAAVRHVVLGTVLIEPVLLALRRLAHIDASARRFATDDDTETVAGSPSYTSRAAETASGSSP